MRPALLKGSEYSYSRAIPGRRGIADDPYNRGTYASTVNISEFQYLMYRPL
jgi:hypothetical protein